MSSKELFIPQALPSLMRTARAAGELIMSYYKSGQTVDKKVDASPVTEADRAADRLIVAGLRELALNWPIVSEEGDKPDVAKAEYFWLVDPLDGTKSFIRGKGHFTVNIALISPLRAPVLGTIYDPVDDAMYVGSPAGAFCSMDGGDLHPIKVRGHHEGIKAALVSHSHLTPETEDYLVEKGIGERIPCASSIKFCWLAEGKADVYPRFGPTMEWDTAAGHAILHAAGGEMTMPDGSPFHYGKPGFANGNFIAAGYR